jgi:DNA polymerase III gamma/tau subunit
MKNPFAWSPREALTLVDLLRKPRGGVANTNYELMVKAADRIDALVDAIIRADQYEMNKKARDILHTALEEI